MPVPMEYRRASEEFEYFLSSVIKESGLTTRNQAYTMAEAVLTVFRKRLAVRDALRFANVLPAVLKAIFVSDWNSDTPAVPFAARENMTREVQAFRADHNFSPDTAIENVATALRAHVDRQAFDLVLAGLPAEAVAYWQASGDSTASTRTLAPSESRA